MFNLFRRIDWTSWSVRGSVRRWRCWKLCSIRTSSGSLTPGSRQWRVTNAPSWWQSSWRLGLLKCESWLLLFFKLMFKSYRYYRIQDSVPKPPFTFWFLHTQQHLQQSLCFFLNLFQVPEQVPSDEAEAAATLEFPDPEGITVSPLSLSTHPASRP